MPEPDGYSLSWSELDKPSPSYRQSDSHRNASYESGTASAWTDDRPDGGYSWMTDEQAPGSSWPSFSGDGVAAGAPKPGNAIRGLPPVPDEPLPIYPPGPFAAWNRGAAAADLLEPPGQGRPAVREDPAPMLATATITPDQFDTNHSMPAIKDPVLTQSRAATGRGPATGSRTAARASAAQQRAATPAKNRTQSGHGTRGTARSKKGSRRQPVRLAIGTAAVIIVAVAAILVISSLSKPGTKGSANDANNKPSRPKVSTSPTPTAPAGKWQYIGTRLTDPIPLSEHELFPGAFVTGGVYFHTTILQEGNSCRTALIGAAIQAAVKKAGCSQVLRASYVARLDKAMATIGVFNLATSTGASAAALRAGRAEFVGELAAKNGVTNRLGQGSGLEEAVVKGHYLVLVWAEYIDLSAPKTAAQRAALTSFMNTLVQTTVNTSLSYRMVEGKPTPTRTASH